MNNNNNELGSSSDIDASTEPSNYTEETAASYLGVSRHTLKKWRRQGKGPAYHKVGGHAIRYFRRDLDALLEKGRYEPLAG